MRCGVPTKHEPPTSGSSAAFLRRSSSAASQRRRSGARPSFVRFAFPLLGALISMLVLAAAAAAAPAKVGLGTATSFSVLGGSTVTNTGPTTMFGDLGLSPGSSVTGAPHVLGQSHVDDAVAIAAKNDLTTAYNDAASRPTEGGAGTDLAGQTFTAGVRTASSSLLLSSGSVILDAQGDPNAVFIFQIGSTLTTGSNTTVQLVNGAQACNVFWQVGSSATLGTGTHFVGTVMAAATITANTAATIHGRLLAQTGAVNLDTNTITTSTCAEGSGETTTSDETTALQAANAAIAASGAAPTGTAHPPVGSSTAAAKRRAAARRAAAHRSAARKAAARKAAARRAAARRAATERRTQAQPASPHGRGSFTG